MDQIKVLALRYLKTAWRHRWAALGLTWLVCIGGWVAVYTMPNQFESSARLYVDADAVLAPLLRGIAAESSPASEIDILQRTLLSRPNLETLISKTDLGLQVNSVQERDRLIQTLQQSIKIKSETRNLFSIVYRDTIPRRATEIVQTLVTMFVEKATGGNRTDMDNAKRFLEHQIASYEQQLRGAEKRRADFRTRYLDLLPDNNGGSKLDQASGSVRSLQGHLTDSRARRDQLKKELDATPPLLVTEGGYAGGGGGSSRLQAAEQQLADLRLRYTDAHPDVIQLRNQIAAMRANPGASAGPSAAPATPSGGSPPRGGRSTPNPVYEQLKTRLVDTEADLASLQRQLDEATADRDRLEQVVRAQPGIQAESEALDRDYNVLRKNYEELLERRESANIAQAADTQADKVKLQVIDPPQIPRVPVAPNRPLLISGVLLAGIGAGFGLAFVLAQLDRSFRTVDDLRALGLTVLGGISSIRLPQPRRHIRGALVFGAVFGMLIAAYGGLMSHMARVATGA